MRGEGEEGPVERAQDRSRGDKLRDEGSTVTILTQRHSMAGAVDVVCQVSRM